MLVSLNYYFLVATLLVAIGLYGALCRRNAIVLFMCFELILNGVNLTFITFARFWGDLDGQIMVFVLMVIAAAESAIALALIVALFRTKQTVDMSLVNKMGG
ncbi:MAG TPA: NADH-quinone oxidoreductase subunit NuoK [Oligoflexia bacterium]|nr:NADH-quinone oxidoreductase subunit NuoK [Oligoflexia bacterium]HMP27587.1 NADH-quinone oxidoreductase subunit NuoK [Oligoflexia bacterium]